MTRIRGIAEIVLNVVDLDASLAFYRDVLGLGVISPPDLATPVFFKAGPGQAGVPQMIVLVKLPADSGAFQPPSHLHHLALEVAPEEFDAVLESLRGHGLEIRTGRHPVIPSRTIYVDDPDGNEVEIICREDG
jgi:catechol 2,3-dioxygenase-like lactoylglutathione lyase family enzyme